jgi:chemotaxis signal transduction protein
VAELRNVIVFSLGPARYALELRWVREVVSLGFVTTVPTAPTALGGVCNLHGAILPVLDVAVLVGGEPGAPARQGDSAVVVDAEGQVCALRVDQIDQVASLVESDGAVIDATGRALRLLDPARLVHAALERVTAQAERAG